MTLRRTALFLFLAASTVGCASTGMSDNAQETFVARKRLTREMIGRSEWGAAFFYAEQLHRERPRDPEILILRGIVFRERGLPNEAENDLREALRLQERSPEAHAALGVLLDAQGRGAEAEKHHQRAIGLSPDNPAHLNNLGFSLFLRGKHKDAIASYQRAARLAPTSRRVRTNLGFAYGAAGDLPRAAREFEMGGTPSESKNNLGFVYERRGDLARAYELYIEAVKLEPRSEKARANLAHVAETLGREIPSDLPAAPAANPRSKRP